jgi:hypothetical protein
MLSKLRKELNAKEKLVSKERKSELRINTKMDYDSISDLITEKLIVKVKENVC